jgi:hypothetical protein
MNNTARPYNIKGTDKQGRRVTVRLLPGFNVVNDEHWAAVKGLKFVKVLHDDDKIDFGTSLDKKEGRKSPSKAVPEPPSPSGKK